VIANAITVTTLSLELGGNPGISRDNPLERHHRDALSGKAHAPQNNLIRTMLAKAAFSRHAATPAVALDPVPVRSHQQPRLAVVGRS
jgi:alkylation response protein AidB-like acyl-CoA dehydrogenase